MNYINFNYDMPPSQNQLPQVINMNMPPSKTSSMNDLPKNISQPSSKPPSYTSFTSTTQNQMKQQGFEISDKNSSQSKQQMTLN